MAERIVIAELQVEGIEQLIQETGDLTARQRELQTQNRALVRETNNLTTATEEQRRTFVQNNNLARSIGRQVNVNNRIIQTQTEVTRNLDAALNRQLNTEEEIRANNSELIAIRRTLNRNTDEGTESIRQINEQLNINNELIRENVSQYEQQRIGIGNYREAITEALGELNVFNGGLLGFVQRAQEAGGASALLTSSLTAVTQGIIGVTRASLAFLATPIGAIVGAIGAAFLLVSSALNRSEQATNTLSRAFSGLTGIFNGFLNVIQPVGEFLVDVIASAIEDIVDAALDASEAITDLQASFLRFIGFDDAADSIQGFNQQIRETVEASRQLEAITQRLAEAERNVTRDQALAEAQAERLRQERDNERLSIEQRIDANDRLGVALQNQLAQELEVAQLAVEAARFRIQVEGETADALDERAQALARVAEIQNRITGQQSEQLTNQVALLREARDIARERAESQAEVLDLERQIFEEENRLLERNAQERLQFNEQLAEQELQALRFRLEQGLITQQEFNLREIQLRNELIEQQREIDEAELERVRGFEERRDALLDEIRLARIEDEQERELFRIEQEFQRSVEELEQLELTETQRTELLLLLTEQRELALQEIRSRFQDEAIQNLQAFFAQETALAVQAAEARIAVQAAVANALVGLLGNSLAAQLAAIAVEAAFEVARVQATTAAAQAQNIAQATATAPPPFNIPFIAAAVAQNVGLETNSRVQIARIIASAAIGGLGAVAQNIGGNVGQGIGNLGEGLQGAVPRGERGITIKGRRHSQGGETIHDRFGRPIAELESGENMYVLNRRASSLINSLSTINMATGGVPLTTMTNFAQDGGQISRSLAASSGNNLREIQDLINRNISNIRVINDPNETLREGMDVLTVENEANI